MGGIVAGTLPYFLGSVYECGFRRLTIVDSGVPGLDDILSQFDFEIVVFPVEIEGGIFSRSRMANYAVSKSEAEFIAICDGDLIIPRKFAEDGGEYLSEHPGAVILPYGLYMNRIDTDAWRKSGQFPEFKPRCAHEGAGGINWLSRKAFIECGGLNCDFVGWGWEEFEFRDRWIAQGREIYRPDVLVYHPHHERNSRGSEGYYDNTKTNQKRYQELIQSRDWPGFEVKKIRPRER